MLPALLIAGYSVVGLGVFRHLAYRYHSKGNDWFDATIGALFCGAIWPALIGGVLLLGWVKREPFLFKLNRDRRVNKIESR